MAIRPLRFVSGDGFSRAATELIGIGLQPLLFLLGEIGKALRKVLSRVSESGTNRILCYVAPMFVKTVIVFDPHLRKPALPHPTGVSRLLL